MNKNKWLKSLNQELISTFHYKYNSQKSLEKSFQMLALYDVSEQNEELEVEESWELIDDVDCPDELFSSWTFKSTAKDEDEIDSKFCNRCQDYQAHKLVETKTHEKSVCLHCFNKGNV